MKPRLGNIIKEKKTRAGWIGTSTHAQLNSTIGRIETSTRSATTLAGRIGTSTLFCVNTPHCSDTATHYTLAGRHPSTSLAAPPTLATFFFQFHFFEKEAKEGRGRNSLSQ